MVLDLKDLERKLDEALEKETAESLNAFLQSQKHHELVNFLGESTVESLAAEWSVNFDKTVVTVDVSHSGLAASYNYALAA